MDTPPRHVRFLATLGLIAGLAACGGGGPSDLTTSEPPAPAALALSAHGSSAGTVSLAWQPLPAASGYTLERSSGSGGFTEVAQLGAEARSHLDKGLTPQTVYRYRLVAHRDSDTLNAEREASTTADEPETTAEGAVLDELARGVVGPAGGRVASADGRVVVDVPAGAYGTDTTLVLRAQANTAPGGVGDGVQLDSSAAPAKPLQLTLDHAPAVFPHVHGLAIAVQQADGSWVAQAMQSSDHAAGRLVVQLPVDTAGTATALAARPRAAAAARRLNIARVQAMYLSPQSARVRTGAGQRFVPHARVLVQDHVDDCDGTAPFCVPMPVLRPRELVFANDKAGYTRQWLVEGTAGGSAAHGTVQAQDVGALYTAPARAPSPNPVTVSFRSIAQKSGRVLELHASVTVVEPMWTGVIHGAMEGTADIGFTFSAEAVWTLSSATSDDVFHATGTQSVHIINVTCTASASPSTVALPPGLLTIDRSTTPATYTLDVGSLWNTVISGSCPTNGSASVGMTVPGQLQTSGALSTDGTRIEGSARLNNIQWEWSLTSQL